MLISKAGHPMIYVIIGKTNNEDSRDLGILYKWRNYVLKFQDILHRSKHLKMREKNRHFSPSDALPSVLAHRRGH